MMKDHENKQVCPSCGLPSTEEIIDENGKLRACSACTLDGTTEPKLDAIAYAVALGHFINRMRISDPKEALNNTRDFITRLPFWQNEEVPKLTLEGLQTARMIIEVFSNINTIGYGDTHIISPDFFISHKWNDQWDREVVDPLVASLKEFGFRVWYDKEMWGKETGKTTDWMRKGIIQARFCIPILISDYFSSENCIFELETILSKEDKFTHIIPIWGKNFDLNLIEKQEWKTKIKEIMGIGWSEWEGDINKLVKQLMNRVYAVEGLQEYDGVPLIATEAKMLEELQEYLAGEKIPSLGSESSKQEDDRTAPPNFGFYHENNRITTLILERKSLKALPKSLSRCIALKELNLKDNRLLDIPVNLPSVISLNLENNQLKSVPKSVTELISIKYLNLSDNQLLALPRSILGLINLEKLQLGNNRLGSLPESFGNLKQLKKIDLRNNRLQSLPKSFSKLINLQSLNLSKNQFDSLPQWVANLINLNYLNLAENKFKNFPDVSTHLTNLKVLYLNQNNIRILPESFGNLINLKELILRDNRINSLP
ncbi:MAG: leucine-rich repeat domain-containing protein, partial [Candidatus Hermodarchaeota archaeon]